MKSWFGGARALWGIFLLSARQNLELVYMSSSSLRWSSLLQQRYLPLRTQRHNSLLLGVPAAAGGVPVEKHEDGAVQAAVDVAMDIHVREPAGDILLFLTGQQEIEKVHSSTLTCPFCHLFPLSIVASWQHFLRS